MLHLQDGQMSDSPEKKYLIAMVSTSVGLLVLTSIYMFVARIFIRDMEYLDISVIPKSSLIPYFILLLITLTLFLVIITLKFQNSRKMLTIIALFMLGFYAILHLMIVLYLIFYEAPDISVSML